LVYADAPELLWPPNLDLKVIKILRKEEDFLSPQVQAKAGVYRDADGHLERILESAQAVGVVLRPDHYVLSYVLKGEQQLSRLDASLFGYYKKG
jgi:hypothetical protein